jgi:hypothetical protein
MAGGASKYKVLPLPVVQKWAKHELSREQLRAGINLARRLRFYPRVPDLSIGRCGQGAELRIEHPSIGRKGWLRAIFWVDEKTKTIYIVDLFWKKRTPSPQLTNCGQIIASSRSKRSWPEAKSRGAELHQLCYVHAKRLGQFL